MRFDGAWRLCEDGVTRPVIEGEIETATGAWLAVPFLVDTAADRTALTAAVLRAVQLPSTEPANQLSGIGGIASTVLVTARLRFYRETTASIYFPGQYAAFTDDQTTDMSVLGRDITNLFPLIIDRPGDAVCMLGPGHRYEIRTA